MEPAAAVPKKSSWKRILLYVLLAFFALVLLIGYFLYTDEKPTELSQIWFDRPDMKEIPPEENAFYLWAAFGVPENQDPVALMQERVESFNNNMNPPSALSVEVLPEDSIFFAINELIEADDVDPETFKKVVTEARFLRERFDRLSSLEAFQTTFEFRQQTPWPGGIGLLKYQNLLNLEIGELYRRGDHDGALELFSQSFNTARFLRSKADFMMAALSLNVLVSRTLRGGLDPLLDHPSEELYSYIRDLPLLTSKEISLKRALRNESMIVINTFQVYTDERKPESIQYRIVARPNATRNLLSEAYGHIADLSELPGPAYMELRDEDIADVNWTHYLRTLVGVSQVESYQGVISYADAGFQVNGLILLLKAKAAILEAGISDDEIPSFLETHHQEFYNPFTRGPLMWNEEEGVLYYTGPDQENSQRDRQLKLHR